MYNTFVNLLLFRNSGAYYQIITKLKRKAGEKMSYKDLFNLISKQWADVNDIKKIGHCGRDHATKIRNIIEEEIIKSGKELPRSKPIVVPMRKIIDYFQLDVDYITLMAKKECLLNQKFGTDKHASIS